MFRGDTYAAPPPSFVRWQDPTGVPPLAVNLDELKKWTNSVVEDTYFDDEIRDIALSAQRAIEHFAQLQLAFSTWVGTTSHLGDRLRIMRRPFVDVTGIEYVATDGTLTAMPADLWHALPVDRGCGMIFLGEGLQWPAMARRYDAVRITCRSGYAVTQEDRDAGAPELPFDILQALRHTFASLDANRGDEGVSQGQVSVFAMKNGSNASVVPKQAVSMLARHKYISVATA